MHHSERGYVVPNPVPAKYTNQVGVTMTPEDDAGLAAWAELLGRSKSEIARECLEAGMAKQRRAYERQAGVTEMPAGVFERHLAVAVRRGEAQIQRRKDYDERTRRGETAMSVTIGKAPGEASGV